MAWRQMTWAYVACFIDCDGSIRYRHEKGPGAYRFRVSFYQSQKQAEVLYEIQEFLAMRGIYAKMVTLKTSRKHSLEMNLQVEGAKNVAKLLRRVEPHLRVKGRQAAEALAVFEERRQEAISSGNKRLLKAYAAGYEPVNRRGC